MDSKTPDKQDSQSSLLESSTMNDRDASPADNINVLERRKSQQKLNECYKDDSNLEEEDDGTVAIARRVALARKSNPKKRPKYSHTKMPLDRKKSLQKHSTKTNSPEDDSNQRVQKRRVHLTSKKPPSSKHQRNVNSDGNKTDASEISRDDSSPYDSNNSDLEHDFSARKTPDSSSNEKQIHSHSDSSDGDATIVNCVASDGSINSNNFQSTSDISESQFTATKQDKLFSNLLRQQELSDGDTIKHEDEEVNPPGKMYARDVSFIKEEEELKTCDEDSFSSCNDHLLTSQALLPNESNVSLEYQLNKGLSKNTVFIHEAVSSEYPSSLEVNINDCSNTNLSDRDVKDFESSADKGNDLPEQNSSSSMYNLVMAEDSLHTRSDPDDDSPKAAMLFSNISSYALTKESVNTGIARSRSQEFANMKKELEELREAAKLRSSSLPHDISQTNVAQGVIDCEEVREESPDDKVIHQSHVNEPSGQQARRPNERHRTFTKNSERLETKAGTVPKTYSKKTIPTSPMITPRSSPKSSNTRRVDSKTVSRCNPKRVIPPISPRNGSSSPRGRFLGLSRLSPLSGPSKAAPSHTSPVTSRVLSNIRSALSGCQSPSARQFRNQPLRGSTSSQTSPSTRTTEPVRSQTYTLFGRGGKTLAKSIITHKEPLKSSKPVVAALKLKDGITNGNVTIRTTSTSAQIRHLTGAQRVASARMSVTRKVFTADVNKSRSRSQDETAINEQHLTESPTAEEVNLNENQTGTAIFQKLEESSILLKNDRLSKTGKSMAWEINLAMKSSQETSPRSDVQRATESAQPTRETVPDVRCRSSAVATNHDASTINSGPRFARSPGKPDDSSPEPGTKTHASADAESQSRSGRPGVYSPRRSPVNTPVSRKCSPPRTRLVSPETSRVSTSTRPGAISPRVSLTRPANSQRICLAKQPQSPVASKANFRCSYVAPSPRSQARSVATSTQNLTNSVATSPRSYQAHSSRSPESSVPTSPRSYPATRQAESPRNLTNSVATSPRSYQAHSSRSPESSVPTSPRSYPATRQAESPRNLTNSVATSPRSYQAHSSRSPESSVPTSPRSYPATRQAESPRNLTNAVATSPRSYQAHSSRSPESSVPTSPRSYPATRQAETPRNLTNSVAISPRSYQAHSSRSPESSVPTSPRSYPATRQAESPRNPSNSEETSPRSYPLPSQRSPESSVPTTRQSYPPSPVPSSLQSYPARPHALSPRSSLVKPGPISPRPGTPIKPRNTVHERTAHHRHNKVTVSTPTAMTTDTDISPKRNVGSEPTMPRFRPITRSAPPSPRHPPHNTATKKRSASSEMQKMTETTYLEQFCGKSEKLKEEMIFSRPANVEAYVSYACPTNQSQERYITDRNAYPMLRSRCDFQSASDYEDDETVKFHEESSPRALKVRRGRFVEDRRAIDSDFEMAPDHVVYRQMAGKPVHRDVHAFDYQHDNDYSYAQQTERSVIREVQRLGFHETYTPNSGRYAIRKVQRSGYQHDNEDAHIHQRDNDLHREIQTVGYQHGNDESVRNYETGKRETTKKRDDCGYNVMLTRDVLLRVDSMDGVDQESSSFGPQTQIIIRTLQPTGGESRNQKAASPTPSRVAFIQKGSLCQSFLRRHEERENVREESPRRMESKKVRVLKNRLDHDVMEAERKCVTSPRSPQTRARDSEPHNIPVKAERYSRSNESSRERSMKSSKDCRYKRIVNEDLEKNAVIIECTNLADRINASRIQSESPPLIISPEKVSDYFKKYTSGIDPPLEPTRQKSKTTVTAARGCDIMPSPEATIADTAARMLQQLSPANSQNFDALLEEIVGKSISACLKKVMSRSMLSKNKSVSTSTTDLSINPRSAATPSVPSRARTVCLPIQGQPTGIMKEIQTDMPSKSSLKRSKTVDENQSKLYTSYVSPATSDKHVSMHEKKQKGSIKKSASKMLTKMKSLIVVHPRRSFSKSPKPSSANKSDKEKDVRQSGKSSRSKKSYKQYVNKISENASRMFAATESKIKSGYRSLSSIRKRKSCSKEKVDKKKPPKNVASQDSDNYVTLLLGQAGENCKRIGNPPFIPCDKMREIVEKHFHASWTDIPQNEKPNEVLRRPKAAFNIPDRPSKNHRRGSRHRGEKLHNNKQESNASSHDEAYEQKTTRKSKGSRKKEVKELCLFGWPTADENRNIVAESPIGIPTKSKSERRLIAKALSNTATKEHIPLQRDKDTSAKDVRKHIKNVDKNSHSPTADKDNIAKKELQKVTHEIQSYHLPLSFRRDGTKTSTESIGGGVRETMWAVTRISFYNDGSRAYEVMQPSEKKPRNVPVETHNVLIMTAPKKDSVPAQVYRCFASKTNVK